MIDEEALQVHLTEMKQQAWWPLVELEMKQQRDKWFWFQCLECGHVWGSEQHIPDREWCQCASVEEPELIGGPWSDEEYAEYDASQYDTQYDSSGYRLP